MRVCTELAAKVLTNEMQRHIPIVRESLPHERKQFVHIPRRTYGNNRKYPWHELQVGDSFFVPCHGPYREKLMNSLTSCRGNAQKNGKRFALRMKVGGIRVWRMK